MPRKSDITAVAKVARWWRSLGHVDRAFILSVAYLVVVYSLAIGVALCLESLM